MLISERRQFACCTNVSIVVAPLLIADFSQLLTAKVYQTDKEERDKNISSLQVNRHTRQLLINPNIMAHYLEQINKLAMAAGCAVNPLEKAPLILLEDEVNNLIVENESKQQALKMLTEELEKTMSQLNAQREFDQRFREGVEEEVKQFKQKNEILEHYNDLIEKEEFLPNKLKIEVDQHAAKFHDQLKSIYNKAMQVVEEKTKLYQLQGQCEELRQKISE